MNEQYIIKKAWALSILGVLPFAWATLEIWLNINWLSGFFGVSAYFIFLSYAAIILSFLGGIMWGGVLHTKGNSSLAGWLLILSVIPALIAWVAVLLFPQNIAWLLLIGGFLSLLKIEHFMQQINLIPYWFWLLRRNITIAVITMILLNWFHIA